MAISDFRNMRHGTLRREAILNWLKVQMDFVGLPVNNKYQLIIEYDPDLQVLLKKGILKRKRVGSGYRPTFNRRSEKKQTYLIMA